MSNEKTFSMSHVDGILRAIEQLAYEALKIKSNIAGKICCLSAIGELVSVGNNIARLIQEQNKKGENDGDPG